MHHRLLFCCLCLAAGACSCPVRGAAEKPETAEESVEKTVKLFDNSSVSRKELLARFETIDRGFPPGTHSEEVHQAIDLLRRMVAEDDAHARHSSAITTRERVADLIFRLRDQKGMHTMYFGGGSVYDIFQNRSRTGHPNEEKTPAHCLVHLGADAVPQLLGALEDERFTRCVQMTGSGWRTSYRTLRVGDCALAILERIAARSFCIFRRSAASNKAARNWWREFQRKGEKRMLIEGTAAGNSDCSTQAERLVAKYPEAAFDALAQGIRAGKERWVRSSLLYHVAELKGDRPLALLRAELKGPLFESRLVAAQGLLRHGHADGIDAMIAEWQDLRGKEDDPDESRNGFYDSFSINHLIAFLEECGQPRAARALGVGLRQRPAWLRWDVVWSLNNRTLWRDGSPLPRNVQEALDQVLVDCLDDAEENVGMGWQVGHRMHNDPRICDTAARVLSEVWKKPKLFNLDAPLPTRDRQRIVLKNLWLVKHGKAPVPLPVPRTIPVLSEQRVRPFVEGILKVDDPRERATALKRLEELGLPALPAARKLLARTTSNRDARGDLGRLLVRMAFVVREVRFAESSVKPAKRLREMVEGWKGKPLRSRAVVDLLVAASAGLPEGARGIHVQVRRPTDNTGCVVTVCLLRDHRSNRAVQSWYVYQRLMVGETWLLSQVTAADADENPRPPLPRESWKDFLDRMKEALQAGPEKECFLQLACVGRG